MHVLDAKQFSPEEMGEIFGLADGFKQELQTAEGRKHLANKHFGEQIGSIFYAASTRTKGSFEIAALKLGMGVFETENAAEFSSISKGETIEDTARVLGSYGISALIMRTKEEGMAARAASASPVPVINGGDGSGEHPTQSLLDAYTIQDNLGRLEGLNVVMGGDLKRGRTVRSLSQILAKYEGNHVTYVSVPELKMGDDIKAALENQGTRYSETTDMYEPLHDADVVYWTRMQTERPDGSGGEYSMRPEDFIIDNTALEAMNPGAIIMHPLPRIVEISIEVDDDPRAKYFQQAENGLYIRMALLDQAVSSANQD